jgi:AcrR family transcriptional regulator
MRCMVRVTADTKLATRRRILEAAQALFERVGFEEAATRDIAAAAGIATGTLFNYFATKEAIALALVAESLREAHGQFEKRGRSESLEEDLFALVAAELRGLKRLRSFIRPALEVALSPLAKAAASSDGEAIRVDHLELVDRLLAAHGLAEPPSFVTMHLYWTLYTGVLAFWASDSSPHQEQTLAVLDHSLKTFMGTLPMPAAPRRDQEKRHVAQDRRATRRVAGSR